MVRERWFGINHKESMVTQMTDSAVVSALLATMVCASMRADPPSAEQSYPCQAYATLNILSLYYSINATGFAVLCMAYLQPIEGGSAEKFLSSAALYLGEPSTGICFSLCLWLNALGVGRTGQHAACFACLRYSCLPCASSCARSG